MKIAMKKLVSLFALAALVMAPAALKSEEYESTGGYGYEEARRAPSVAPAVALGVIALAAIIALAIQNSGNGHGHSHSN